MGAGGMKRPGAAGAQPQSQPLGRSSILPMAMQQRIAANKAAMQPQQMPMQQMPPPQMQPQQMSMDQQGGFPQMGKQGGPMQPQGGPMGGPMMGQQDGPMQQMPMGPQGGMAGGKGGMPGAQNPMMPMGPQGGGMPPWAQHFLAQQKQGGMPGAGPAPNAMQQFSQQQGLAGLMGPQQSSTNSLQ